MSTPLHPSAKRYPYDEEEDYQTPGQSARSRSKRPKRDSSLNRSAGQQRLLLKTKSEQSPDVVSPGPPGYVPIQSRFVNEPTLLQQSARRPRPLTQHQLAVEQYRRQRIEYLLSRRKNETYRLLRAKRESQIPFGRCGRLLQGVPDGYDTEDEENSWGKGGLLPNPEEEEDFGECANYFLSVIRKATRRLDRWDYENANGPKRDRRREREERRARMEMAAMEDPVETGRTSTSARNRARNARNARRRAEAAARPKVGAVAASHATDSRPSGGSGVAGTGKTAIEMTTKGEDGLDDIDRELLGEASGDDDDDQQAPPQPYHPPGPGYEDSYMGGMSSDSSDAELDDVQVAGEGYENSSAYGGESSSMAGGDPDGERGGGGGGGAGEPRVGGTDGIMGQR